MTYEQLLLLHSILRLVTLNISPPGGAESEGIVELTLDEFTFKYEKTTAHVANVKLQLASLSVIDLLQVHLLIIIKF